jgi:histidinol-phosphate aminotransferase
MNLLGLVRDDLRDFAGYSSARRTSNSGSIWLNANESPWRNAADANGEGVHRYPEPQPGALRAALAALYGVRPEQLLIGRGSDEAIDLLVRAFCRPGVDAVLIAPPVFGMYAVCARLQGAALVEVALRDRKRWTGLRSRCDAARRAGAGVKLVFLCSPANPTGAALPRAAILALAQTPAGARPARGGRGLRRILDVRVGGQRRVQPGQSCGAAHLVEGARARRRADRMPDCGAGADRLAAQLPGAVSHCPRRACSLRSPHWRPRLGFVPAERVAAIRAERERLQRELPHIEGVRRVYASQGNYLLVRFVDAALALQRSVERRRRGARHARRRRASAMPCASASARWRRTTPCWRPATGGGGRMSATADPVRRPRRHLIEEPADFQIDAYAKLRFVEGVIPAMLRLRDAGYEFVMVTNQDGLGTERFRAPTFEARIA